MIKSILVPATGDENADLTVFAAALSIARPFSSHIDALHVRLDPVDAALAMVPDAGGVGALPAGFIDSLERQAVERESAAQRSFAEFCAREHVPAVSTPAEAGRGPSAQWHVEIGRQPDWMTVYGMTNDLIVAARSAGDPAGGRETLEALLLGTGRPLLIPGAMAMSTGVADKIAIAWKPTPQAVRAIAFAMPFLARARRIVVMTVDEGKGNRDGADRLVRNLAWRGFDAAAEPLTARNKDAADTLLAAASADCGMLVMGGYGHSRLREWMFGGFTERVISEAPIPVLMAH